jgi:hypothetical protein
VVGAALLDVAGEKVEDYFLTFNQFSFTQDGPQVVYNLIRHALATHPDWVVLSGDERSAFQIRPRLLPHKAARHVVRGIEQFRPTTSLPTRDATMTET